MFAIAFVIAMLSISSGDGAETSPQPPPPQAVSTGDDDISEPERPATPSAETEPPPPQADAQVPEPPSQSASTDQVQPPQPPQAAQQSEPVAPVEVEEPDPLTGFIVPIGGACITDFEGHLPGAARAYRNDGVHEGLDFYEWASCVAINRDTRILAAKDGIVIRADLDYVDVTPEDWARFEEAAFEGEEILDELRGRQVWIEHAGGIVTRYAHLNRIAAGIGVGVHVSRGQLIGHPGESGQRESYAAPGTDIHLHFEIRVGDGWLGEGLTPLEARDLYLQAFGLLGD